MYESEFTSNPPAQTPQTLRGRKRKVTVYLPEEWVAALEKLAAERGAAVSAVVRDLVYEFLKSVRH